MSQYAFGSGVLFGRSNDNSPATPVRFGGLQGVSIDFAFTLKELYGQYQFPIALGRGTGKITGKADMAQLNAQVYNDLFFGYANVSTGSQPISVAEAQTVANTVNVTHNGANYLRDLGVVLASDNTVFTRQNTPITANGTYAVNESNGLYTFNSGQANANVLISYEWTDAANGKTISLTNQLLGNAPTFLAAFQTTFRSKSLTLVLNACMSSKLSLPSKLEDFEIPSFDWQSFADDSGNIGKLYLAE
jgi:hypothetical protein